MKLHLYSSDPSVCAILEQRASQYAAREHDSGFDLECYDNGHSDATIYALLTTRVKALVTDNSSGYCMAFYLMARSSLPSRGSVS